jgi:hypothetical protein
VINLFIMKRESETYRKDLHMSVGVMKDLHRSVGVMKDLHRSVGVNPITVVLCNSVCD